MASDLNPTLPDGIYNDIIFYDGLRIQEIAGRIGTDTTSGVGTAQRTWRVFGTTDPQAARAAIIDTPDLQLLIYDDFFLESLSYEQGPSPNEWDFTGNYDAATPPDPAYGGGYTVSIDTTGAQILQTSSYEQNGFPAPSLDAPDFKNSIDVQDGKPQGVQRIIPALKINIRSKIATAHISSPIAYAKQVASLTGTTNDDTFLTFAAGELLFAGASGEVVATNPQLTFTFLASANITGGTIGDITGINKKGHEYLWFLFDHDKDPTTNMLISKPRACYVDRVYGEGDHSLLKIGVP